MEQKMTFEEQEIMRSAYVFLRDHCCPPKNSDERTDEWWKQAAGEMAAVSARWNNHPLAVEVLMAIYNYIDRKAKRITEETDHV